MLEMATYVASGYAKIAENGSVTKTQGNGISECLLPDNVFKSSPGLVAQDLLKVPGQPEFDASLFLDMHELLKIAVQLPYQFLLHPPFLPFIQSHKYPLTCFRAESKNVGRTLLSVDRGLTDKSVRPT